MGSVFREFGESLKDCTACLQDLRVCAKAGKRSKSNFVQGQARTDAFRSHLRDYTQVFDKRECLTNKTLDKFASIFPNLMSQFGGLWVS